jgi:hypothetical protein
MRHLRLVQHKAGTARRLDYRDQQGQGRADLQLRDLGIVGDLNVVVLTEKVKARGG